MVSAGCGQVPGEQLIDTVNGMVGDAGEHLAQVALRIETVQLRRADQAVKDGGALTPRIRAGKQVVLASQSDRPQRPFGGGMPTSGLCRHLNRWSRSTDVQA